MRSPAIWLAVALAAYWQLDWWKLLTLVVLISWVAYHVGVDRGIDDTLAFFRKHGGG